MELISHKEKTIILLIGRTGDGKSSCGNLFVRKLGGFDCFGEDSGANSHTHIPKSETIGDFIIVDNPGLVDSQGKEQDQKNLISIVNHAKSLGYVTVFVQILNYGSHRFDYAMQCALKLIVDSFGLDSLTHFCLMYTHLPNLTKKREDEIKKRNSEIVAIVNERCHSNIDTLPWFCVDSHPEALATDHVPEESIHKFMEGIDKQLDKFLLFASLQPQFSTKSAVFGEYDVEKATREAKEAQERAAQQIKAVENLIAEERKRHSEEKQKLMSLIEKEKVDREFAGKTISRNKEHRTILISSTTNPKMERVTVEYDRQRNSPLGWLFGMTKKDQRTETKHTGNVVERVFAIQEREVEFLGNGERKEGGWITVNTQSEKYTLCI